MLHRFPYFFHVHPHGAGVKFIPVEDGLHTGLQLRVHGGIDTQPAAVDSLIGRIGVTGKLGHGGEQADQFVVHHVIHKPGMGKLNRRGLAVSELLLQGCVTLFLVDVAEAQHGSQNGGHYFQGFCFTVQRVIVVGGVDDTGQHRSFGQAQFGDAFVEIGLRRRLHPVGVVAEVDDIQVHLQDFVFVIAALDQDGIVRFLGFALVGLFEGEKSVAGELHGDGAAPLGDAAVAQVGQQGA